MSTGAGSRSRAGSRRRYAVPLAAAVLLAACSGEPGDPDTPSTTGVGSAVPGTTPPPVEQSSGPTAIPPTPSPPTPSPTTPSPTAPSPTAPSPTAPSPTTTADALGGYGVSAGHPAAVQAGMEVLEQGGSAVDAAIAAAFAASVAEPFASGPGGGGAALVAEPGADPVSYEYREVVAEDGVVPATATGIPGYVAGMAQLHGAHGELDWSVLLEPAVELAEDGVPVSDFLAAEMRSVNGQQATAGLDAFHDDSGGLLEAGDLLVQPDLADTLRTLADEGPGAFYDGSLTPRLTDLDGIDAASLAAYRVQVGPPAHGPLGEVQVLSAPPPLVGAALIQHLQVAEALGVGETEPGSADHIDLASQAWTVAEDSVSTVLGDPAFVDVPVDRLTDPRVNAGLAEELPALAGGPLAQELAAGPPAVPTGSTTQVTVIGPDGTAVSMTNTILSFWGSGQQVGGFFVNDTLRRFGIGEGPANEPEAGRRSVSWMSPTIVLDGDGTPVLALGTPGGRLIPGVLSGVLTRHLLQGQSLEEAVLAPRFQVQDGVVEVEDVGSEVVEELRSRGYGVHLRTDYPRMFGSVQALRVDPATGEVSGATDPRREGAFEVAPPPTG